MPLFGKKKKEESSEKKEKNGPPSYPSQPAGYPCQGASGGYPTQPPAYHPTGTNYPTLPTGGQGYPGTQPPPVQTYGMPAAPPAYTPVQMTVVSQDSFDAGARFGPGTGTNRTVPPPPPGVMPNVAQMAASQGHNVVVGQRQQTLMGGTGDAGAVFW